MSLRRTRGRGVRRLVGLVVAASVVSGLLVVGQAATAPSASALSPADFDPGNIISDEKFFDAAAMDETAIQGFLRAQVGGCTNGNCLDVLRVNTTTRPADAMCRQYTGAASEPASRVVAKVAQACGINPQVLLVTLQKEQSLISGSVARAPSAARIDRSMGYACPDNTAQPGWCAPEFAGLYNQVYKAAWQFKRYANPAGTSNYFTWFAPGTTPSVQYTPSAACGSSPVRIQNQATANLYYYTPYQPNAASLAHRLSGAAAPSSCGSFGNLNFWIFFNQWFGSPTTNVPPIGNVEKITGGVGKVDVVGWALDRVTPDPITVHVYVGPKGTAVPANLARTDIAALYPQLGSKHGFSASVAADPGTWNVCVIALGQARGNNVELRCQTVVVTTASPVGALDQVRATPAGVEVSGWALDPDTTAPIGVHLYVDTVGKGVRADRERPDLAIPYPGKGTAHGYAATLPASPGAHRVCAYGMNVGAGGNVELGCRTVLVPGSSPVGNLEVASASGGSVRVAGWALDGDTVDSIPVHVYVDGVGRAVTADDARKDILAAYPAYGAAHGFDETFPAAPGAHQVCVYGYNIGAGQNTLYRCATVTVAAPAPIIGNGGSPFGNLESVVASRGTVSVSGWAIDPDTAKSIAVHVYVGTAGTALIADRSRPDVARAWPAAGPLHGFQVDLPAAAGPQKVCVYGMNSGRGATVELGCRTVTVPAS